MQPGAFLQIIHAVELKTREITSLSTAPKLICVDLDQGSFFLFLEFVSVVDFGLREIVVGVGCKVTKRSETRDHGETQRINHVPSCMYM